jgi:16S rRNA (guanine527-N7)-methyltransferase
MGRLEAFRDVLVLENERQNLVSRTSLDTFWARHVLDSAQLARFAPAKAAKWLDLGAGAGFPGLIVPLVHSATITLVESRRLRVEFLGRAVEVLGLKDRVGILCAKAESVEVGPVDVISARAFAPLDKLLTLGSRFSHERTVWILPKGRNAKSELEAARCSWQGDFRLEPSLTDPEAGIIVASAIERRTRGKRRR